MALPRIKSNRHHEINFVEGVVIIDGIPQPLMKVITVPRDGTTFYEDALVRMTQLSPCEQMLYNWCCMEMGESMIIDSDPYQRNRFIEYAYKMKIDYIDDTIYRAFKALVEIGLLIKLAQGRYKVNPRFCFKGRDGRKRQIKMASDNRTLNTDYIVNKGRPIKKDLIKDI